ncbi:MAG: ATP-binding protein [Opitutaceae bacterium]
MGTEQTPGPARGSELPRNRGAPLIDRAPLPIIEVQGRTHLVSYVNEAFCQLLGKAQEKIVGSPFAEIVPGGVECLPTLDHVYKTDESALLTPEVGGRPISSSWLHAMWPALDPNARGEDVIIQMTQASDFRENAATINGALLISGLHQHELTAEAVKLNAQLESEIIERRLAEAALLAANHRLADQAGELERLVAERTSKLRETVGELEGLSHSIAHEMRAPLRGMQGFAQLLLDEHADQLGGEALSYLERISSSASRMDSLIQDVLNYTHVLQSSVGLAPVDLDWLVRDIVATHPDWRLPQVEILIDGTLPLVLGHEGFLTQCVSNLLSNAVKFVAQGVTPRVLIRAEDRPSSPSQPGWPAETHKIAERGQTAAVTRVWFENNGIGIAAKDHDRVFHMFDRINPAAEYVGTGIGMIIARKAVERMGGRMGFESEVGSGSKFWIELRTSSTPSDTDE